MWCSIICNLINLLQEWMLCCAPSFAICYSSESGKSFPESSMTRPKKPGPRTQYLFHSAVVCEHRCLQIPVQPLLALWFCPYDQRNQPTKSNKIHETLPPEIKHIHTIKPPCSYCATFCVPPVSNPRGKVVILPKMSTSAPTWRSQTVTAWTSHKKRPCGTAKGPKIWHLKRCSCWVCRHGTSTSSTSSTMAS